MKTISLNRNRRSKMWPLPSGRFSQGLRAIRFRDTQTPAEAIDFLVGAAQSLAADQNIDFAFIHLPVPHPRGTYHRATGQIGFGGSYIDNLALSDK